jgi:glucan-binding YG repeat protein
MTEGWLKLDSIWFYLDPKQEGKMVKGWFKDETNNWFFANDKGKCLFGLQTINEKKYYISSNGMVTGFICIDKQWKFFNEDGILATDVELAVKSVKVNSDGSIEKIIN